MNAFVKRRIRNFSILTFVIVLVTLWVRAEKTALRQSAYSTGYLLLGAVVLLACYNVRKKLVMLPIGTSATWLQWHIYVALGTFPVLLLHTGFQIPHGWMNLLLGVAFLLTFLSGVVGLYLSRTIPPQLARIGEEVIYERIPMFRRRLRNEARQVVMESVTETGTTTLADFYTNRLYDFFEQPRNLGYLLHPTSRLRKALLDELGDLQRYMSDTERQIQERMFSLVRKKDDLDFHEARQMLLKNWMFAHISLTYMLLSLATIHMILAHAFAGGGAP